MVQLVFYITAFIAALSGGCVIFSSNPVRSALFLVLTFFAMAVTWLLANAEFLSLILIVVYVGAVMTLFLFVIMMINIDVAVKETRWKIYVPSAIFLVLIMSMMGYVFRPDHLHLTQPLMHAQTQSNTLAIGEVLYTQYAYASEMAAVLLLIAIVAAIALVHRPPRECKTQNPVEQMNVRREDRVRLVKG